MNQNYTPRSFMCSKGNNTKHLQCGTCLLGSTPVTTTQAGMQ